MSVHWFIAKYIPDLQRNEPNNVGVILVRDGFPLSRFTGERPDGGIDGRSAKYIRSVDTYRSWVHHWRRLANETDGSERLLKEVPEGRSGENYYLEVGGEVLLGGELKKDSRDLLNDLYSRLVDRTSDSQAENISMLADRVISGVQPRLQRPIQRETLVTVDTEGNLDDLTFDYTYRNGRPHFMQRVSLGFTDNRSWERVHAVAWSFAAVQQASDKALREADLIALVKPREPDSALIRQLRQLERRANVVDISEPEQAQERLLELFTEGEQRGRM